MRSIKISARAYVNTERERESEVQRKLKLARTSSSVMTYREDLIFVTRMKFDFVSGEEKKDNQGVYTTRALSKSTCAFESMHARANACML